MDTEQPGHRGGWNEITPHLKLTFSRFQWPRSTVHRLLSWFGCYLLLFLISFNPTLAGLFNPFAAFYLNHELLGGYIALTSYGAWMPWKRIDGLVAINKTTHSCLYQFINQGPRSIAHALRPTTKQISKFNWETASVTPVRGPRSMEQGSGKVLIVDHMWWSAKLLL